jgi:hypothetical protein
MTGWYSLEVLKANKLRRQAKELELTIRRSRIGLQLINKYGAIVLGKKKGATVDEITERLDFIEKRASWAIPEPKTDRPNSSEDPSLPHIGRQLRFLILSICPV